VSAAPDRDRQFLGHPRGLGVIVFTEAWERFSFYGMQALLVLYMAGYLLQPDNVSQVVGFGGFRTALEAVFGPLSTQALATQIFGLYVGMVYFLPVFGGLLGDRWLGQRRAVILGAVSMAIGHFLMAFEAAFLFALLALIVGSGLLKGNLVSQVGGLYARTDARRDRGFSIYCLAINVGAFVAPLVCGTLGEVYGWHYGFTAAGIGMLIGLAIYLVNQGDLPPDVSSAAASAPRPRLQPGDGRVIGGLLVVFFIGTLYWTAQTQVWNTYPLWIKARVARDFFGLTIPVTWFQSLDSLAVLVLAPAVIWLWKRQAARGVEPDDLKKIGIGCGVFALGCLELFAAETTSGGRPVSALYPALFHFVSAIGYLYVFPVALALFSRAAPPAVNAMMAGVCYLSLFAGSVASGWLGRFYEVLTPAQFWLMHAAIVAAGTLLMLLLRAPLARTLRLSEPRVEPAAITAAAALESRT
jgi:POT family proton-dependent oligopeptide transporter